MGTFNPKLYMNQKFVALLIILVGCLVMLPLGYISPEVFQTVILWGFTIFAGSDTVELGSIQFKEFMQRKEEISRLSNQGAPHPRSAPTQ